MGRELLGCDAPMALADPPAPGEVVHPQRRRVGSGDRLVHDPASSEQGHQERQLFDEVRCVLEQEPAFDEALVDEAEFLLLEVAQAAVHQLGGFRRRAGGEVAPFDQAPSQSPLEAASSATPAPVIPPPTTTTSKVSSASLVRATFRSNIVAGRLIKAPVRKPATNHREDLGYR